MAERIYHATRRRPLVSRLSGLLAALALCAALLSPSAAGARKDVPSEIAGIKLGTSIRDAGGLIDASTATPMFRLDALARADVADLPGFRSGYVTYGVCSQKDRILRIKLNYADDSDALFEKLLAALKKRYGRPEEWRGDPFGTLKTWKWSFTAENGHSISLILQHYAGDDESFSQGNSIRLADRTAIDEETACHRGKSESEASPSKSGKQAQAASFEDLLPK